MVTALTAVQGFLSWEGSQSSSMPNDTLVVAMRDSMVIGRILRSREAGLLKYKSRIYSLIVCILYYHSLDSSHSSHFPCDKSLEKKCSQTCDMKEVDPKGASIPMSHVPCPSILCLTHSDYTEYEDIEARCPSTLPLWNLVNVYGPWMRKGREGRDGLEML